MAYNDNVLHIFMQNGRSQFDSSTKPPYMKNFFILFHVVKEKFFYNYEFRLRISSLQNFYFIAFASYDECKGFIHWLLMLI